MTPKDLTIVVPVYNEVENVRPLLDEITQALTPENLDYEVLFVDDGSNDGSFAALQQLAAEDNRIVVVKFRRNHGQTAAFAAGFDYAQGKQIVTIDADRQNDPADIPRMIAKLEEGYDVVNGWRQNRQDAFLVRKVPSFIANRLIARASNVQLHDRGCSLRIFRAEVTRELRLYGEMHRFIPEMVNNAGFTMAEVPVNHRPRVAGESKYGISRTFRVIVDLMTVVFLRNYGDRPMHLFGMLGLIMGGLGGLTLFYLLLVKIGAGVSGGWAGFQAEEIGSRPLLSLGIMLVVLGVQFLVMGLIAELIVRVYYEAQNKPVYHIRTIIGREEIKD
ncbi:MAG TPA: glycosyltransferase [Anaerolineae bacterium]|nr:glycosyltransferase [Anaerolineae bacterium]HIP71272.1 glycosyltransferase [Anaerolineae bacterium]